MLMSGQHMASLWLLVCAYILDAVDDYYNIVLSKFVHCLLHVLGNAIPPFGLILIDKVFILCVLASVHLTKNATQQFLEYFRNSSTLISVSFAFNFLDTIGSELKLCESNI